MGVILFFNRNFVSRPEFVTATRKAGARQLISGVWTDLPGTDEEIVQQTWKEIIANLMPGAVITGRTGFRYAPIDGRLFVSHPRNRPLVLPGLTVYSDGSKEPRQSDDVPLNSDATLFGASQVRALIENAETRGRPSENTSRMSRDELHDEVARIVTGSDDRQRKYLLDEVRSRQQNAATKSVLAFLEAAIHHRPTVDSGSVAFSAITSGTPFDHRRINLFERAVDELSRLSAPQRFVEDHRRTRLAPFFESYFSNYIEGTQFELEEAASVVFDNETLDRPKDAHDIAATYRLVNDDHAMRQLPATSEEFLSTLQNRHKVLMEPRSDAMPGQWKTRMNRAGLTEFVAPDQVIGTLTEGWRLGQELDDPFSRAVYSMFLVSEVHPFTDGNGRSARIAMNNELHAGGMHHIIIPTILRADYMSVLSRATAGNGLDGLHRLLKLAHRWSAAAPFYDLETGEHYLYATNALTDSIDAERSGIGLRILSPAQFSELAQLAEENRKTNNELLETGSMFENVLSEAQRAQQTSDDR